MRATLILLTLAAGIALCDCGGYRTGASPSQSPSSSGPQTSSPAAGYAILVTEQDQTATMQVGQKMLLELHTKPGMTYWSPVRSTDLSVLMPLPIDVLVPQGVTVAAFQAVAPGQTEVTAFAGPVCSPGQACPAYVIAYRLRVTITPR